MALPYRLLILLLSLLFTIVLAQDNDSEIDTSPPPDVPKPPANYTYTVPNSKGVTYNISYLDCYVLRSNAEGHPTNLFLDVEGPFQGGEGLYENCPDLCYNDGFKYWGLSQGNKCYCSLDVDLAEVSTQCTSLCPGRDTRICGGNGAANVFHIDYAYFPSGVRSPTKTATYNNPRGEFYLFCFLIDGFERVDMSADVSSYDLSD